MHPRRGSASSVGDSPKVYPSKRDWWLTLLLWAAALLLAAGAADILRSPLALVAKVSLATVSLGGLVVCLWPLYSTSYALTATHLLVRCGPCKWSVPLDAIETVAPSRNPLASPACSLDRLHIRYRGARFGLLISPADKSAFLRDLSQACPALTLRGDRATRD